MPPPNEHRAFDLSGPIYRAHPQDRKQRRRQAAARPADPDAQMAMVLGAGVAFIAGLGVLAILLPA